MEEFRLEASKGGLRDLVSPWEPWWGSTEAQNLRLSANGTRIVESQSADGSDVESISCLPHPPMNPLPQVRELTNAVSSVRWNIVDLL